MTKYVKNCPGCNWKHTIEISKDVKVISGELKLSCQKCKKIFEVFPSCAGLL